ncbi:histidine kinase, partial [bacterium]|nr:histidine kinase [bacterium]
TVSVQQRQDDLLLMVSDDGQGFDVQQVGRAKTFGLLGMRERAIALGGTLDIESQVGSGTRIVVKIPMGVSELWSSP